MIKTIANQDLDALLGGPSTYMREDILQYLEEINFNATEFALPYGTLAY